MRLVPFIAHVQVIPERPGKRFEYLKSLAKFAVLVQNELESVSGLTVGTPGGGQNVSSSDIQHRGGLGSYANGTAAKPQFGNAPAQLMFTGFYQSSNANVSAYADHQLFSGGEVYTGPGANTAMAVPTTTFANEVKALKTALETAVTAALPDGTAFEIFRIDYSGVVYGDKGYHFPR